MSHEIETAVYSSTEGAGWTGLGQVIPADVARDPRKIAELCGALYTVEKRECYYKANDAYVRADGRDVLVRSDTGKMLEVVSDTRYHVENRQPVDIFEAFRDQLNNHGLEVSHAAVLRGGAVITVCAMLPAADDIQVNGKDTVKNYVTLSTGYDKKHGTKATKGSIRVVCANTLAYSLDRAADTDQLRTVRASTAMEFDTLANLISNVKELIACERAQFDNMANTRMSTDAVARYFADVLEINIADLGKYNANGRKVISTKSDNMLKALASAYSSAPGAGMASGTAWGALNAVTYFATHQKTVRDTSGDGTDAARVASNFSGDAAKLKARALMLAANLAVAA